MRLVTWSANGDAPAPGVELPNGDIVPVSRVLGAGAPATVAGLLARWPEVRDRLAEADPDRDVIAGEDVRLHAPLGERVLIVGTGGSYRDHLAEMGEDAPPTIPWFVQSPNAVIGPGEPIKLPPGMAERVDFEGELCVVFGRPCHAVTEDDALSYVAGYTIMNDVSARDGLPAIAAAATAHEGRWAWTDMLLGKQFPSFAPLGPAVTTADEIADPAALHLTTTVNGLVMQDATTADLAVGIPALVARMSRYFSFRPGDVLSTGTPAGVGASRTPPVYLRPGDVVTVAVTGVGTLSNPVTA